MLRALADEPRGLRVEMVDESPSIYLDHWALRRIADNSTLAERLANAIASRAGTLCVSAWNILEFSKHSYPEEIERAEALFETCFPRLFFIDCDPMAVLQREDLLKSGQASVAPHADLEVLKILPALESTGLQPIGVRGLFNEVADSGLDGKLLALGGTFQSQIESLRREIQTDPDLRSRARIPQPGPGEQRATRAILREVVRAISLDPSMKISENDATDFLHAVVPIAYCEMIFLDRRWASLGRQAIARLRKAGQRAPMAEIFSGRQGQVLRFLAHLEAGACEGSAPATS